MSEFQKAAVELIREVSVQLILIAVGAIAVTGTIFSSRTTPTTAKKSFHWAVVLFIASVLAGVVALGDAVSQLSDSKFDPWEWPMRFAYGLQLALMFFGGAFFARYLVKNIP